jgi:hypothetical protein
MVRPRFRQSHAADPARVRRLTLALAEVDRGEVTKADFRRARGVTYDAAVVLVRNGGHWPEHVVAAARIGVTVDEYTARRSEGWAWCPGLTDTPGHWTRDTGERCCDCADRDRVRRLGPWHTDEVCPYPASGRAATQWRTRRQVRLYLLAEALARHLQALCVG